MLCMIMLAYKKVIQGFHGDREDFYLKQFFLSYLICCYDWKCPIFISMQHYSSHCFLFSILNWVHIFYKAFVVKLLELFGPLSALLYCVAITVVILLKLNILQKGPFYQNQILNSFLLSWVICSLLWVLDLNLSVSKSPLDVQIDIALLQLSATCFWWLPGQTPALHHHLPPIFFKFISFLKMAISFSLISIYISPLLC